MKLRRLPKIVDAITDKHIDEDIHKYEEDDKLYGTIYVNNFGHETFGVPSKSLIISILGIVVCCFFTYAFLTSKDQDNLVPAVLGLLFIFVGVFSAVKTPKKIYEHLVLDSCIQEIPVTVKSVQSKVKVRDGGNKRTKYYYKVGFLTDEGKITYLKTHDRNDEILVGETGRLMYDTDSNQVHLYLQD